MYWFLYDVNGVIKEAQKVDVTVWTNANDYSGVLSADELDPVAQDAFAKPNEYTVQNGQLVHSNAPTVADLLQQAKLAKKAELYQAWQNACLTFQSSALDTVHTYTNDDKAIGRYNAIMNRIIKDSTWNPPDIYTHEAGFVSHTRVQFTQVYDDGMADEQAKEQNYEQKCVDADNATTVDTVNAVMW